MIRRAALPLIVVAAAVITGCDDRPSAHHIDDLYLTPAQERDVFVASTDHLGPDTDVVVLADAPKARYEGGAIVLTGGRELEVVQPHAWRSSTGTALSAEEARRMIDRAQRLDAAMRDIGESARDLRDDLDRRAAEAQRAGAQLDERDRQLRAGAARADRARDAEAAAVLAARDRDLADSARARDAALVAADAAFADHQRRLVADFDRRDASAAAAARAADETIAQRQRLDCASARDAGKDDAYLVELDRRHGEERARAAAEHERARAALATERARAVDRLRDERDVAATTAQRVAAERDERIRRSRAEELARIAAERERAGDRSTVLSGSGPWRGAAAPGDGDQASSAAARSAISVPVRAAASPTTGSPAGTGLDIAERPASQDGPRSERASTAADVQREPLMADHDAAAAAGSTAPLRDAASGSSAATAATGATAVRSAATP